ncbi:MAG: hypothetical protein GTO40_23640 [Deltaproteobacteria bacterium]|nr:hypothetical protein [Deltaproteobacteria bacterium]
MALVIKAEKLRGLITLDEAIAAVEEGFRDQGEFPHFSLPRSRMLHEDRRLTIHPGGCRNQGVAGTFIHYERFSYTREDQQYTHAGQRVYVVYSSETAELHAIIVGSLPLFDFDSVTEHFATETSLTSAVGTKYLAREDAQIMGLYGTGRQARRHLMTMSAIRSLKKVKVYSRSSENRMAFFGLMQPYVDAELEPVNRPELAAEGVDMIVCATNSNVPVLHGEWLSPGVHVTSIVGSNKELLQQGLVSAPRREIDDEVLRRADVIVATLVEQGKQDQQGDLIDPVNKGIIKWDDLRELGGLIAAKVPGRTALQQITLFKQNSDQGVGFMALGKLAFEKARAAGIGTEI